MPEAKFCDQCGKSLVPLKVPHVERTCPDCDKSIFLVEPGEGGRGIKVEAGDKFTIPAGWLSLSLDPVKSTGRLYRPGLVWLVTEFLAGGLPTDADDLSAYLDKLHKEADDILEGSEKLSHLNLETEDGAERAIAVLEKDRMSIEWWAMILGASVADLRDRLDAGETREAALASLRIQAARSMLVFKQSLEEHLWTGYRHTSLIYDIASASARTPQEAEQIQALRPLFSKLDEDVLHTWVAGNVDIGPRIGVTSVGEELLKPLAQYHLALFERRRKDEQLEREHRTGVWANRIAGAAAGAALMGALVGILKALGLF